MNNTTLILTSIYSNLWGTEFGGRPSREHHYKISLLNILNLKPNKVICFTSNEEIESLKQFFYNEQNVDSSLLELRVFDLSKTRYFEKIRSKKNLEFMKTSDRCYEIQYNKLFWCDDLNEIFDYEKIYWFDSGLSHGGLFPEEYSYGEGYNKNFQFTLFNENFLNYLNNITENKFVLVGKNNEGQFYWSTTLPDNYYENYNKNYHVIGGFFGGPTELYRKISKMFDDLLVNLLVSDENLYFEEQIFSTLYYNNSQLFELLTFDDWYRRDGQDSNIKYFYDIFLLGNDFDKKNYTNLINENNLSEELVKSIKILIKEVLLEEGILKKKL